MTKPRIVGIGASAGGVKALQELFHALPDRLGAAFVVVVHLDPESHSDLAAILAAQTRMRVIQVQGTVPLEADHVYVVPPNRRLQITDHDLAAVEFDEPRGQRAPIDSFFRSLAGQHGDGFAVILTGSGTDGTIGVKAIKESGGIILVQDPEEAEHPSMPRSAIATGFADFVLPVHEIARHLGELIRDSGKILLDQAADGDEELVTRILAHVRVRTGHDFSSYKRSTVLRRIARRIQITRSTDLSDYYSYLRDQAEEAQALVNDLLISVTTFFRDADTFKALAAQVIPLLFEGKEASDSVRIWVPGCATGEEAYSVGILLLEEMAQRDIRPRIQVFGSDLDNAALATAREGRYPGAIEADVSEERLRRFFTREGDHYRVKRELREVAIFAFHSVLRDPPFSRMDLISCRNLLIYLDRSLQEQVCSTFHYALNPGGYLLLGSSETADHPPGLFRPIDRRCRIYQSSMLPGERPHPLPRLLGSLRVHEYRAQTSRLATPSSAVGEAVSHRKALEKIAPPSILVDDSHRVVHLSDQAGRYLQPAGGPLTGDLGDLVREELRFEMRAALHRAFEQHSSTLSVPIPVRFNGRPHRVSFQVKPVSEDAEQPPRQAVVIFMEGEAVEETTLASGVAAGDGTPNHVVQRLTQELQATQTRLRTTREESEGANEELRAANEELQSINEEYRSTSEELETSKEELQSINEELQTVNNELKIKLEAVSRANSDLQNLMAATDFGTLFLDSKLHIKRFTEHVTDLFRLTASDEGRPITDFSNQLEYEGLVEDARAVIAHLAPIRREIRSRDHHWYDIRLRPYRTVDDKIDGVVISFIDVTERRKTEDALKQSEKRQETMVRELTHRVKNMLTVVQAMASQSLQGSPSKEEFTQRFNGRLTALAEAHNLLVEADWKGAELGELARKQLKPYAAANANRIRIEGNPIILPADLATPFGLVLHELATNAAKYGALSGPTGTISLNWTLNSGNNPSVLVVVWKEQGGPPVTAPKEHGLGSHLIRGGIPAARVEHEFRPDGVVCKIELPLPPRPVEIA